MHAVGVLHRDMKPTNVLMEGRSPVLIDFGLARVAEDPRLTQTGWLLGTPGYLAPEILYGDDATTASDVHAWAATVAFAATGRPPYGTGPAMAIMDRVRRGEHDLSGVPDARSTGCCASASPRSRGPAGGARAARVHSTSCARPRTWPRRNPRPSSGRMPIAPRAARRRRRRSTRSRRSRPRRTPSRIGPPPPSTPGHSRSAGARRPRRATRTVLPPAQPSHAGGRRRASENPEQVAASRCCSCWASARWPARRSPTRRTPGPRSSRLVVLLLRTASVTRQRHARRRMVRGRPRWYDVPTTVAVTARLPRARAVRLARAGRAGGLLRDGAVLARLPAGADRRRQPGDGRPRRSRPALWWGPGSSRVREMTRGLVDRTARSEFGGWFVVAMCALGTAVLLGCCSTADPTGPPR